MMDQRLALVSRAEKVGSSVAVEDWVAPYARFLGVNPTVEKTLFTCLTSSLQRGLPPGWTLQVDPKQRTYFWNQNSGESLWTHPDHEIFVAVIDVFRMGLQQSDPSRFLRRVFQGLDKQCSTELEHWTGPFLTQEGEQYWHDTESGVSVWVDPAIEVSRQHVVRSSLVLALLAEVERRESPPTSQVRTNSPEKKSITPPLLDLKRLKPPVTPPKMSPLQEEKDEIESMESETPTPRKPLKKGKKERSPSKKLKHLKPPRPQKAAPEPEPDPEEGGPPTPARREELSDSPSPSAQSSCMSSSSRGDFEDQAASSFRDDSCSKTAEKGAGAPPVSNTAPATLDKEAQSFRSQTAESCPSDAEDGEDCGSPTPGCLLTRNVASAPTQANKGALASPKGKAPEEQDLCRRPESQRPSRSAEEATEPVAASTSQEALAVPPPADSPHTAPADVRTEAPAGAVSGPNGPGALLPTLDEAEASAVSGSNVSHRAIKGPPTPVARTQEAAKTAPAQDSEEAPLSDCAPSPGAVQGLPAPAAFATAPPQEVLKAAEAAALTDEAVELPTKTVNKAEGPLAVKGSEPAASKCGPAGESAIPAEAADAAGAPAGVENAEGPSHQAVKAPAPVGNTYSPALATQAAAATEDVVASPVAEEEAEGSSHKGKDESAGHIASSRSTSHEVPEATQVAPLAEQHDDMTCNTGPHLPASSPLPEASQCAPARSLPEAASPQRRESLTSTRMLDAAMKLQRAWRRAAEREHNRRVGRELLRQKRYARLQAARAAAATKIQKVWRGFQARQRCKQLRAELLRKQQEEQRLAERARAVERKAKQQQAALKLLLAWRSSVQRRRNRREGQALLRHMRMLRLQAARTAAATQIQKRWRGLQARRFCKVQRQVRAALAEKTRAAELRAKQQSAASLLQAGWRKIVERRRSRQRSKDLLRQQLLQLEKAQKARAALCIQRCWRGALAQSLARQQAAAAKLQHAWREIVQRRKARMAVQLRQQAVWRRAATTIQQWWRSAIAVERLRVQHAAAGRLQKAWLQKVKRGQSKELLQELRKQPWLELQDQAAVTLQRVLRGAAARRSLARQRGAAVKLQTAWHCAVRRRCLKKEGQELLSQMRRRGLEDRSCRALQRAWRCVVQWRKTRVAARKLRDGRRHLQEASRLRAATTIQRRWRGSAPWERAKMCHEEVVSRAAMDVEAQAALCVQRVWRGFRGRKCVLHMRAALRMARQQNREKAAVKLQRAWVQVVLTRRLRRERRELLRLKHLKEHEALKLHSAIKIQSHWRSLLARRLFKQLQVHAQARLRSVLKRKQRAERLRQLQESAAAKLQRAWRAAVQRRLDKKAGRELLRQRRLLRKANRASAATVIQRIWRGSRARELAQILREELAYRQWAKAEDRKAAASKTRAHRVDAATRLQRAWRRRAAFQYNRRLGNELLRQKRMQRLQAKKVRAALNFQRLWRGHKSRQLFRVLQEEMRARLAEQARQEAEFALSARLHMAAFKIQSAWRKLVEDRQIRLAGLELLQMQKSLQQQALMAHAVMVIQRCWRGSCARRLAARQRVKNRRPKKCRPSREHIKVEETRKEPSRKEQAKLERAKRQQRRVQAASVLQRGWRQVRARLLASHQEVFSRPSSAASSESSASVTSSAHEDGPQLLPHGLEEAENDNAVLPFEGVRDTAWWDLGEAVQAAPAPAQAVKRIAVSAVSSRMSLDGVGSDKLDSWGRTCDADDLIICSPCSTPRDPSIAVAECRRRQGQSPEVLVEVDSLSHIATNFGQSIGSKGRPGTGPVTQVSATGRSHSPLPHSPAMGPKVSFGSALREAGNRLTTFGHRPVTPLVGLPRDFSAPALNPPGTAVMLSVKKERQARPTSSRPTSFHRFV